jgi:uncharacterized repeat protein (TIGR03843 family)
MADRKYDPSNKKDILKILAEGKMTITGQFMRSSNYTFLARLENGQDVIQAVYKPQKGETLLWDFPAGTLCLREVAAFLVSEHLAWDLVPPTVFRKGAPLGKGALQLFVEHDPQLHYFSFEQKTKQRLKPTVLFDLIINNADRKAGHILLDRHDHLWLIDHGTCFHTEFKHRSVVWEFAGQDIPNRLKEDIQQLARALENEQQIKQDFARFISPAEIRAMQTRINILLQLSAFPFPEENRRTIPWPPI